MYLTCRNFSKAFGLDHLVQDRLAAFLGKADFLAQPSMRSFSQPASSGFGDVHVLQREGAAIGALHDARISHRGDLKAQHVVDEDRAIHVGGGKP